MTSAEIIGSLRVILREQSDDSLYSDQFLLNELLTARARITAEKYGNESEVSFTNWQTLTVKLEKTKYVDCGCIKVGCNILKSVYTIPSVVVTYMKKPLIRVRLFSGATLPYVKPERQRTNIYSEVLGDMPAYYIDNGKLIIWNTTALKAVIVEGVFSNPTDLSDINICTEEGDEFEATCYNQTSMVFPADADIIDEMKMRVLQRILPSKNIPDDKTNDSEV